MNGILKAQEDHYVDFVVQSLRSGESLSRSKLENIAEKQYRISDKTIIKELTELAIVKVARSIALGSGETKEKFDKIVNLYERQANLSFRTSQSILFQQYSTPAPIGYLMGVYNEPEEGKMLLEPSAGNGLLTIAWPPNQVWVNELDEVRYKNLVNQGYFTFTQKDATNPVGKLRAFDAVITNPPFGALDDSQKHGGFDIKTLDHHMAIVALDQMKDSGKAAIIIGGHQEWDDKGRIKSGKNRILFNYLYKHYHVEDVINIDGHKLYSRQGTAFNTRIILINGRKAQPEGVAPLKSEVNSQTVRTFDDLYTRVTSLLNETTSDMEKELELEAIALKMQLEMNGMAGPYFPTSDSCNTLDVHTPDSMDFEIHQAAARIQKEVGSLDKYVQEKLGYRSEIDLCRALAAEQIDGVAMGIYNIEKKNQGLIIGDQTGIGKGRQAAAFIRYAVQAGMKPIFISEKPNLFSDIYRDLEDIGSANLKPFIVNSKEAKTAIKNKEGEVMYEPDKKVQESFFNHPDRYNTSDFDFAVTTYSQFNKNQAENGHLTKTDKKGEFLLHVAKDNLIIMDESHNAGGDSNTGAFLQYVLQSTKGVIFLSATFAKRPDNMPIYALKTSMTDANMTREDLVEAIKKGGVALQEILASQLVDEGQMIRRERTFEGIAVNYVTLEEKKQEHRAIADSVTAIVRRIIAFQENYVSDEVEKLDAFAASEGNEVTARGGTEKAGVDNQPYFSKVFNVINQLLFSIKADSIADRAIARLKQGYKPVIAFSSTMESFVDSMDLKTGDTANTDFSQVLIKGLESVLKITTILPDGEKQFDMIDINTLGDEAKAEYWAIRKQIDQASTGITISPIDWIKKRIEAAGFTAMEVTGRSTEFQLNADGSMGLLLTRKKTPTNDAFLSFNNNESDVLMINQSGSTGASAHAVPTSKVPKDKVKPRVMIVLQAELDINREVQKRGRTNRTGQIHLPEYDYLTSEIPAEKRLMMMLQKKLKSLDANTTSNQKQNKKMIDVEDFLNKYGDQVVFEYMGENRELHKQLGTPLGENEKGEPQQTENAAHKVSGRVAVLSCEQQEAFYNEISDRYNDYVQLLIQQGEYDLEVEAMDLQAKTLEKNAVIMGKTNQSVFGDATYLEKVEANNLKKPFSQAELDVMIANELQGRTTEQYKEALTTKAMDFLKKRALDEVEKSTERFNKKIGIELAKDKPNDDKIAEMRQQMDKSEKSIKEKAGNLFNTFRDSFDFFRPGKSIKLPSKNFDGGTEAVKAVVIGIKIDEKKPNPFAPSAVKVAVAFSNSMKYIEYSHSGESMGELQRIQGASFRIYDDYRSEWTDLIKASTSDRGTRYIVTGNILQGFAKYPDGKLVSYTTDDGQTKKGILLPQNFVETASNNKIAVPINKALRTIRGLSTGQAVFMGDWSITRTYQGNYMLIGPGTKQKGGNVFLNKNLLDIVGRFEKISNRMKATFEDRDLQRVTDILHQDHNMSVEMERDDFNEISDLFAEREDKEILIIPKKSHAIDNSLEQELELEAIALQLQLELLDFSPPLRMMAGAQSFDSYEYLKKIEKDYIRTGKTRVDEDYEPEDDEYNQHEVLVPTYRIHNGQEDGTWEDSIDEAIAEAKSKSPETRFSDTFYFVELYFKKGWAQEDNYLVDEKDMELLPLHEALALLPIDFPIKSEFVYQVDLGKSEDGAIELLEEVTQKLGRDILSEHEGLTIRVPHWKDTYNKYRQIVVEKDDEEVGTIKLRIADHSYNPRNNNVDFSGNEGFISVEIANTDPTADRFHGQHSLQYDGTATYDQILDDVNERIKEIIWGWNI